MLNRTQAPEYQTIQSIYIPKAQTRTLDNGLLLHTINAGEQPLLRLECIYRAGTWYESKRTTSLFTSKMLNEGTTTRTSRQISEYVDQYGAFLELNQGVDRITVTLYTLSRFLPQVLELLTDILQNSIFPENELSNLKNITRQNLQVNLEKNAYVANATFRSRLFGEEHPYGKSLQEADIAAITPEDLRQFYAQYLQGRSFDIVLAGAVTEKETEAIGQSLGKLRINQHVPTREQSLALPGQPSPELIERAESVQSTIRIGRRLFVRKHPDYAKLSVLNEVLGGYFGSRLMKNIREDKGYTYGISSNIVTFLNDGYWVIGSDVKKESTQQALDEIAKEVERLTQEPVGEEELKTVKNYMIGSFAGSLNTAFDIADRFKITYFEGLPLDYYDAYIDRIQSVTAEDLLALAQKYLDLNLFQEVVVGGK